MRKRNGQLMWGQGKSESRSMNEIEHERGEKEEARAFCGCCPRSTCDSRRWLWDRRQVPERCFCHFTFDSRTSFSDRVQKWKTSTRWHTTMSPTCRQSRSPGRSRVLPAYVRKFRNSHNPTTWRTSSSAHFLPSGTVSKARLLLSEAMAVTAWSLRFRTSSRSQQRIK